jgi:hypothetical protein
MTEKSASDAGPYRHLQMLEVNQDVFEWYKRFVFRTSAVHIQGNKQSKELISTNYLDVKAALDFSRLHLSHLDSVILKDDSLPLELFVSFEADVRPLVQRLKRQKTDNELNEGYLGIPARTEIRYLDGRAEAVDVHIVDYNSQSQKFFVVNKKLRISAWRSILYLRLPGEQSREALLRAILEHRAVSSQFLKVQNLINRELLRRYSFVQLPDRVLTRIQKLVAVNLLDFNPDSVRKLIVQVEALFVFAVFKSLLKSEGRDPFVKGLLRKYGIPPDTEALATFQPVWHEKLLMPEVRAYDMRSAKVELDNNSIMLMDRRFIKIPELLNSITVRVLGQSKLFEFPFSLSVLLQNSAPGEFSSAEEVNVFPLNHVKFVSAQQVMSSHFHRVAKFKWADQISKSL